MIKLIAFIGLSVALAVAPAFAQEYTGDGNDGSPFRLDPVLDGVFLGTAVGLNGTAFYLDMVTELDRIEFSDTVHDASRVDGFDRVLMYPYSRELEYIGMGMSIASILMPAVLLATPKDAWIPIGTMYAETMLMAYGLKELGKVCVNRPRPYMYFDGYPTDDVDDSDWNNSFPSGHTTLAFAGASFTSYVFGEYFPDSSMRMPVIASSYALALGTAAFRIAGGNHFLTDVIAGAMIGTACGLFVPWFHALSAESSWNMSIQVTPMGMLVSFAL